MRKIKYIFADIDGVLTDGTVRIDAQGTEQKNICYRDLDAIAIGRQAGIEFAFITGENTDIARYIVKRFKIQKAIFGAKDKGQAVLALLQKLQLSADDICYVGDSNRDIPAIQLAGIGAAPQNAAPKARQAAEFVTEACGGQGVLLELVEKIIDENR